MIRRSLVSVSVIAGLLMLTACSGSSTSAPSTSSGPRTSVVAAFYPLQYAAEQIGGDGVDVTNLTPPGVEPHDLELTAAQVAEIAKADVVLYVKGFQPAVDEAIAQQAPDRAIDVSAGLPMLGQDPHVWLDPTNMATIGTQVADALIRATPSQSAMLGHAGDKFGASMLTLGDAYSKGLATCASRDLVVSHEAFAYLADAYGLTQIGISGLSPDAEPSPARMKEVADLVTSKGITTVYYETLVDPKVAQTIADETGAFAAKLDPLEGLVQGSTGNYDSIMRDNLETLRTGQGCS